VIVRHAGQLRFHAGRQDAAAQCELLAVEHRLGGRRLWSRQRIKLRYTRAMLTAALEGKLDGVPMEPHPFFKVMVPKACPDVPSELLQARGMWSDQAAYDQAALDLSGRFSKNFEKFSNVSAEVMEAGPIMLVGGRV